MPVDKKIMSKLQKEYGTKKGTSIYYALEAKGRIKSKTRKKSK